MLGPAYANLVSWFYPFGNTPAVNLFRDIVPRERDRVKVLSVACGDPRSILFSLWSEAAYDSSCKFEFTTCDIEPAVLARNVFLYTFIFDSFSSTPRNDKAVEHSSILWNLFYHLFVPKKDIEVLQIHVAKLIQSSESLEVWGLSKYGRFIQFLGENTLHELRRFWLLYANARNFSTSWHRDFEVRTNRVDTALHGFRSAGAYSLLSLEIMCQAFTDYWNTGVVAGNHQDLGLLGSNQRDCINPMLAYSSVSTDRFAVHYGSDPLLGFHLAEVFGRGTQTSDMPAELAKAAKSQFHDWCWTFLKCLHQENVKISIHCGEALNFCYELQSYQTGYGSPTKLIHFYNRPWSAATLTLIEPEGASLKDNFDVIDTSNLIDSVGILSVLPATAPLLSHGTCSVLYTESLLLAAEDTSKTLNAVLFSDVPAFSLLIGISPVGFLIPTTTDSMGSEILCAMTIKESPGRQQQFRMRVPWKQAALGDRAILNNQRHPESPVFPISANYNELAEWLFSLYLKTFAHEDISHMMSNLRREVLKPLAGSLRYYSRLSYVMLLHFVRTRVITEWRRCIETLLQKIENDRSLLVGSNSLQELYMYLHLAGLWQNPTLEQNARLLTTQFGVPRPATGETGILRNAVVPPLVHVVLIVPRSRLAVFTDESPEKIGTPGLHISIIQAGMFENSFFAIDCCFGRLVPMLDTSDRATIEEDAKGWGGRGDLIATCPIPAFSLLSGPREGLSVSLAVNADTSSSMPRFSKKLGMRMTVFECGLDDQQHLQILREPPAASSIKARVYPKPQTLNNSNEASPSLVSFNPNGTVKSISTRTQFSPNSSESVSLKEGLSISISQNSPCTLRLQIGKSSHDLFYPYPIDGTNSKTRLSRKESWVEVAVQLSPALARGGFEYDPFPVLMQDSKPVVWGFGRVNIHQQPVIPTDGNFDFLNPHMGMALSQSERSAMKARDTHGKVVSSLVDLKESIALLFHSLVGKNGKALGKKVDSFILTKDGDSDTLLFVKAMHHDLDTGSVLLDGFVVPLTEARVPRVQLHVGKLLQSNNHLTIFIEEKEAVLWKQLFPALVERCRFSWEHKKSCEYISQNRIPLSTAHGKSPICSCGEGKDAKDFPSRYNGFAKFATRIAIAPLSAVPYLESMISRELSESMLKDLPAQTRRQIGQGSVDGDTSVSCSHCGTLKEGLKVCSRCEKAKYCNHACQKAAWKEHKKDCRK